MSSTRITAIAAMALILAVGGFIYLSRDDESRADPTNAAQVAMGRTIYAAQCASCHGAALEGQPHWRQRGPNGRLPAPPHDPSGHTWHHPDDALFGITKNGIAAYAPPGYQSDMPAFGGTLSDDEIWAVLAYIKSTWPSEIRERQAALKAAR